MASFFFNHDTNAGISRWLRDRGHSVMSTRDAGLETASDREILLHAGPLGLIVVTHNERHFVRLHQLRNVDHGGILAIPQVSAEEVTMAARAVDWLVTAGLLISNELYRFGIAGRWQHWNEERGWEPV